MRLALVAGFVTALTWPSAHALELEPGQHYRDLAGQIEYREDPDRALTIEQVVAAPERLQPLPGDRVDFGFSNSRYWLRLPVSNPSEVSESWILSTNMRFMQELTLYAVHDGQIEQLLHDGLDTPFTHRVLPHRHLAVPFELAPGEHMDLYISYWSRGTTAIPLSVENPFSFQSLTSFHNTKNAAFYTFALFMLIYSALFWWITRTRSFVAYHLYLWTVVLYVLHMDGYTFMHLWPGWPAWNAYASLPLGLMLNVSAAFFSRRFLQTPRNHPVLDRGMRFIMLAGLALIASSLWVDEAMLKRIAIPLTLACSIFFLSAGIVAYRSKTVGVRFYVVGWFGLTSAALLTTFTHFSAGLLAVGISFEMIKLGVIVDATMMGLALLDRYNVTRRANEELRDRQADAMRHQIALQERLLRLEERYGEADRAARERGLQLASASHDLRQPLIALRLALQRANGSEANGADVRRTLEYLEGLVDRYMEAAVQDQPDASAKPVSLTERFPISLMLENVARMFREDAASKGIELRIVPCSAEVRGDPLVVMRVLGNLTGNAVKYTNEGGVLVGCRRWGHRLVVCVYDTGPGMAPEVLEVVTKAYERGAETGSGGYGLGLAICAKLAGEHGLDLKLASTPGRGTVASFAVEM